VTAGTQTDRGRRRLFWLLAALIVLAGVEVGCRLIERVENALARRKNPHVEAVNQVPAFEVVELEGRKMVRRTGFQPLMYFKQQPFPLERPAGGLRVFVLGGSAAAGWPYHLGDTNISALLERKLRKLYPGRSIEVVNMAAGTYASHRVKLILEEVVRYHPDAILLYNGNNELLEDLVFRPRTPPAPWDRSAAARLSYRVLVALTTPVPRFDVKNYELGDQLSNQLSWAFARASRYREDPRQFQLLLEHYRFNMDAMVTTAEEAKVPLLLVTCPVNLKDWTPDVSRHRRDLSPADRQRFTAAFREGFLALERGDAAAAVAPLRAATAIDGEWAEAHFRLGQALLRTGRRAEAKQEFVQALERDGFPFRELPEFQAVLRELAARRRVPLVDIIPPLEAASGDGIPGYDVFTDYVHLTEQGQEIAAQEMLRALRARGLLAGVSEADVEGTRITIPQTFWPEREVYAADVGYTTAMLQHQYDRLDALYARAVEVFTRASKEDPSLAEHCRERLHTYQEVQAAAVAYRDLLRAEKLGLLYQTYTPEQAQAIHERYAGVIRWWTAGSLSDEEFLRRVPRRFRPEN
jgi:tetratricopeptide (TPR) repeat protein